jgi:diguanylate cyclase (GGDEF)-like protein/PAS domain S-box-containing protein
VRARARPRRDKAGNVVLWYGTLEDIHEQVDAELALRSSEERYRLASLATNDVIWDARLDSGRIDWSGAVEDVLGYPEASSGMPRGWWVEQLHPDEREAVLEQLRAVLRSDAESWTQEYRFRTKHGAYIDLLMRGHIVRDGEGQPLRLIGSLVDITARKRSENELRWAAHHDPLTQLPNRKLFSLKLDDALRRAEQEGLSVGLVVVDVDRFKTLNDTLGHGAGDTVLGEVAARLTHSVAPNATVARLGGDEFAIILPELAQTDTRRETLDRILCAMRAPLTYDGRQIDITVSVGAARFPCDGTDAEALLKSADLALYAAKAEGLGKALGFDPTMRDAAESEKKMLRDAREALADDEIVPFYQPKICLRNGEIIGFEALLRRHHRNYGIQPPSTLLAAFDDNRLAPQITDRILAKTLSDILGWLDQGLEFGRIAINASTEDFRRGDLADRILGSLDKTGVAPCRLELEVTETVLLGKHGGKVEEALRALRSAGVSIALDDFGTGYASLTHLRQFPVDTLKIDQSFISRLIDEDQQDAIIVGAIVDLARNLGISTVAEGVESELQAFMLRRRGCQAAQGYLFGRPLPAVRMPSFIKGWGKGTSLWNGAEHREIRSVTINR